MSLKSIFSGAVNFLGRTIRLFRGFAGAVVGLCAAIFILMLGTYFYFASGLPDITSIDSYTPPVISEVFSDDGTRIGEFWEECRIFIPYEDIPKMVALAFIDSEDARFFDHKGVDLRSIVRAFLANIRAGEITQGGSTITQQVTRALLLSRERKLARKVKEAILATRIEHYLSKEQILTIYLNQIYLGNRSYGVAAAARNYFRKEPKDLTIGQIAMIAGLPSAPNTFSPLNNPAEARKRQLHVLGRMVDEGHITKDEANAAAQEHFEIYAAGVDKSFNDKDAAYFVEHVRRIVKEIYGDDFLYRKGLKIYTTVNMPMQRAGATAVRKGIESLDRRQGWRGPLGHVAPDEMDKKLAEIDRENAISTTGEIINWPPESDSAQYLVRLIPGERYKAIVSYLEEDAIILRVGRFPGRIGKSAYSWARPFSNSWLGMDEGNYVSDPSRIVKPGDIILAEYVAGSEFRLAQIPMIESALMSMDPHTGYIKAMVGGYDFEKSEFNRTTQAMRQPGSAFKPFVYAAALDKGYTMNTTIMDQPVTYNVGRNQFWSPKNYDGKHKGPTSFMNALMFSRNIPTVKITYDIGTHYLTAFTRKLGVTTPIEKYLSMALGSNAVFLKDIVQAYSVFPNMGKMAPAVAIVKITDLKGELLQSIGPSPAADAAAEKPVKDKKAAPDEGEKKIKVGSAEMVLQETDLNPELFREGLATIERDALILTDLEVKTLYGEQIPPGHVITPQTAYLMTQMLKAVVDGGTGSRIRELGKPAGGKTGTTNDETDTWFIGFVPDLIAGVWIGFDEVKPIGKKVTGGSIAAPVFLDFMKEATKDMEAKDFEKPEGFPSGDVANLAGGSALFGSRPSQDFDAASSGADRAGRFFEEDLESWDAPIDDPSTLD
ncbi:MAG: PBP1A family penicillin-binding protein [Myxococcales bacterium]|nr:PBP1A family penicillin-binding protein [Myxococcales bacterium]